jgi:hypothetical protein
MLVIMRQTILGVPMLKEGELIGAIILYRQDGTANLNIK